MIKTGILGATGLVGQRFIQLLHAHPWFEITALMASERSTGKQYGDIGRWYLDTDIPDEIKGLNVVSADSSDVDADIVFSALPSGVAREVEPQFAKAGYIVASNASAFRMHDDVPLVIPEVNAEHLDLIEVQKKNRSWEGFIVTNPNCTVIMMALTLKPLDKFGIERVHMASMQAVSGAGYAGVPSMAIVDNIIPYIKDEEEKVEEEALRLLGHYDGSKVNDARFTVSTSCHRVQTLDGHTEAVWVEMRDNPTPEEVKQAFLEFKSELRTPTAPEKPIVVREEPDRPQPRLDRDAGNGMSVSVGRIRKDAHGVKYICMGHNTIRGAAGASILNAELMVEKGYLKK